MHPKYLTTQELADRYRNSPSAIRTWRRRGYGPKGFAAGRKWLYDLEEVERWEVELRAQETDGEGD